MIYKITLKAYHERMKNKDNTEVYIFFGIIILFILITSGFYKDVLKFIFKILRPYFFFAIICLAIWGLFYLIVSFFSNKNDK